MITQYNLGCPSLLHGFYELLRELYGDEFKLINLQVGEVDQDSIRDIPCETISVQPYSAKDVLSALYLGKKIKAETGISLTDAFELIKQSDCVIDLYGIEYCDKFPRKSISKALVPMSSVVSSAFAAAAKKYGIRCVKTPASYGPITTEYTRRIAKYTFNYLFDYVLAREQNSLHAIKTIGVKTPLEFSPDLANLMICKEPKKGESNLLIGISISHQIIRQWENSEEYTTCIIELIKHIQDKYHCKVVLIPNEFHPQSGYNDLDVAEEICRELKYEGRTVDVADSVNMTSSDVKSLISQCEIMVSSRYHSCVASLSAGVPTLVIGWHYKYQELMALYGQSQWLLSEKNCNAVTLVNMFDQLWNNKTQAHETISEQFIDVKKQVIEKCRIMFGDI